MNLRQFGRGARVLLSNGATAEVVAPTEDGVRMRIRYVRLAVLAGAGWERGLVHGGRGGGGG